MKVHSRGHSTSIGGQPPCPACPQHVRGDALPKDRLPIGKARIVRSGRDLSIVTYSAMVHEALAVAKEFSARGVEIEVVDLRSVKPLDTDTVLASVARTGRLLCVGESFPWGGATAEIIARVATEAIAGIERGAATLDDLRRRCCHCGLPSLFV